MGQSMSQSMIRKIHEIKTDILRLAYEDSGPKNAQPILLLHGWPDSPRTWDQVLPLLHKAGFRTVVPYLRGYGPSRFRDPLLGRKPRRTGQPVALAQDVIDLADRLKLKQFHFAGHDWGARAGYALAALFPQRLKSLTAISVPFHPGKAALPDFPQTQAYWYQWLLCTKPGEKKFREDPVAFGRAQWNTWSPSGWYAESDLAEASKSWVTLDFQEVVLQYYRSRWGHAELDPGYSAAQSRFEATKMLDVPAQLVHGIEDSCLLAESTDHTEQFFTDGYRRVLLPRVGHFPQREDHEATAAAILELVSRTS